MNGIALLLIVGIYAIKRKNATIEISEKFKYARRVPIDRSIQLLRN